jgi:hypothetical protein
VDGGTEQPIEPKSISVSATVGDLLFYFSAPSPSAVEFYADKEQKNKIFKGSDTSLLLKDIMTDLWLKNTQTEVPIIYVFIVAEDRLANLIIPPDWTIETITISSSDTIGEVVKQAEQFLQKDERCESGFYGAARDEEGPLFQITTIVADIRDWPEDLWIRPSNEMRDHVLYLDLIRTPELRTLGELIARDHSGCVAINRSGVV